MSGAAELLKMRGFHTRNGNAIWSATAVRDILRRFCPEVVPPTVSRGVKAAAPFALYRLVICHCGKVMTGSRDRNRYVRYFCMNSRADPDHGQMSIAESQLRPAIKAELALFRLPMDAVAEGEINDARVAELQARQSRVQEMRLDGVIDRDEARTETARINGELEKLEVTGRIIEVRADIPLDGDPKLVNEALRRLWERIELDGEMRVERVVWREPSFRLEPTWPVLRAVVGAG